MAGMTRALAMTAAIGLSGPALSGEGDGKPETERVSTTPPTMMASYRAVS